MYVMYKQPTFRICVAITILAVVILLASPLTQSDDSSAEVDAVLEYSFDVVGATVIGLENRYDATVVNVPETVEKGGMTYNVIAIGDGAFEGCGTLLKVNAGKNVKTVGEGAFIKCRGLTSVSMEGAETIGKDAFNGCWSLSEATFPEAKFIGPSAFRSCINPNLLYSAPKAVTIEEYAFKNARFESFSIHKTITSINRTAFEDCHELANFDIEHGPHVSSREWGALHGRRQYCIVVPHGENRRR